MAVLRLIPAHAGNIPKPPYQSCQTSAHPHSHREHSFISFILSSHFGSSPLLRRTQNDTARTLRPSDSSPLARGALGSQGRRKPRRRLIPARAGTIRGLKSPGGRARAHPRSRGEHFSVSLLPGIWTGSSPLARGTSPHPRRPCPPGRLIPARAGNIRRAVLSAGGLQAHPRSRGEHGFTAGTSHRGRGSSPLARGTYTKKAHEVEGNRLIPARAGNIHVASLTRPVVPAHPRSRGEHAGILKSMCERHGSSPLARGTFLGFVVCSAVCRLIPARAGNISV